MEAPIPHRCWILLMGIDTLRILIRRVDGEMGDIYGGDPLGGVATSENIGKINSGLSSRANPYSPMQTVKHMV